MMKKHKVIEIFNFFTLGVFTLIFAFFACNTGYTLVTNSFAEQFKIDEVTSRYISFNYAENDGYIIRIDNPKVVGDFKGKRLLKNDFFDFEVSISKEYVRKDSVEYEIVAIPMGNAIGEQYIKFHLTDQDNKSLSGYENAVPVFSAFSDSAEGKVIHSGAFNKSDLENKYRLRIWVSEKYSGDVSTGLVYKLYVRIRE